MLKYISLLFLLLSACNPFAPAYDPEGLSGFNSLGDPSSVQGYFKLFKNAYELRDTNLYGRLFAPNFVFVSYDFEKGQEFSWDRATEMNISYRLFQNVQQINLDWNFILEADTTDTTAFIVRNFNLSVVENQQNAYTGTGRARFRLKRSRLGEPWKATYWFDDSDF
ncbi:MAG: hypothetical protein ACKVTZ_08140 [Bacteroidia bacterium]